ncbi:hypothetical protein [Staphylococcus sp. Marseille-Q1834]|uniref:hypothetical protein n=1 Tax=Staphylococcus sp. Marseille-Q1834 TaxID=2866594 RepID=UPI0012B703E9|nr:hypothetical protein [Staphylococcus sp. Marseille-Q1834]
MSVHADEHYEEFEPSGISREELMELDELKELVEKFKNNSDDQQLKERINDEFSKWKMYVKDQYKPEDTTDKERLSNIADKVHSDINAGFEYNDGEKVYDFLKASYQRGKEDLVYGRTLILFSEEKIIHRAMTFFDSTEENHELVLFINSKNIEISKEIMSDDYVHGLEIERDYLDTLFK